MRHFFITAACLLWLTCLAGVAQAADNASEIQNSENTKVFELSAPEYRRFKLSKGSCVTVRALNLHATQSRVEVDIFVNDIPEGPTQEGVVTKGWLAKGKCQPGQGTLYVQVMWGRVRFTITVP